MGNAYATGQTGGGGGVKIATGSFTPATNTNRIIIPSNETGFKANYFSAVSRLINSDNNAIFVMIKSPNFADTWVVRNAWSERDTAYSDNSKWVVFENDNSITLTAPPPMVRFGQNLTYDWVAMQI